MASRCLRDNMPSHVADVQPLRNLLLEARCCPRCTRRFSTLHSLMRHLRNNVRDCHVAHEGGRDVSRCALVQLMCWTYDLSAYIVGSECPIQLHGAAATLTKQWPHTDR